KKYVNVMRSTKTKEKCPKCQAPYSVETLSVKRFIDDIEAWNKDNTKFIGGTLIGLKDGSYSEQSAVKDSNLLFSTNSVHIRKLTNLGSTNWNRYNWKYVIKQIDLQKKGLKKESQLKNARKKIVQRVLLSYTGIQLPFSIELISAIHRQREFTGKMVNNKWINCINVQINSTVRYHKFLLLMKEQTNTLLVPTLEIDLGWHTHQIHASLYRAFTQKHLGRLVNHNDNLDKGKLSDGFASTAQAWYKKYNEPYTHVNPSKYRLTTKKKILSVIIPPYGLSVLYQLKKYKKENATKENLRDSNIGTSDKNNSQTDKKDEKRYSETCGVVGFTGEGGDCGGCGEYSSCEGCIFYSPVINFPNSIMKICLRFDIL
ncbi:9028_t:CDS:2, partial [Funneliformis caledonium]